MKKDWLLWFILFCAIVYRFWLWEHFAGWEESDYGNIAMVQGVWKSGFRQYDMNHMPGYYGFSALFLFFIEDAVFVSKLTASLGGSFALLSIVYIMKRYVGINPAIALCFALIIQPEFSLYSASALREPLYTAFICGMLYGLLKERWVWVGVFASLGFLVRFELPLVLLPLLFWGWKKYSWKEPAIVLGILGFGIAAWMLYCFEVYETIQFWSHAAKSNVKTGLGGEAQTTGEWFFRGLKTSFLLFSTILSTRVGVLIWCGWLLSPLFIQKEQKIWWVFILSISLVGVWLAIAFFAQHEVEHNLYWKWMYPLVPFVSFCGVFTLWRISKDWSLQLRALFWAVVLGSTMSSHYQESLSQRERADRLYAPQIKLATFIESHAPKDRLLLVDNIPACWLNRKPNQFRLISWFDVPVKPSNPKMFARWLAEKNVWGVLWFKERWTKAPIVAPFLSEGEEWSYGTLSLTEHSREREYGWIFYLRED